MSKLTTELASFVVGVCFALLLLGGSQRPTFARPGNSISNPAGLAPFAPTVPALQSHFTGISFEKRVQRLDGLDCTACTFANVTLEYSGGAVRLVRPKFTGMIRVRFTGAAANALGVASFLTVMRQNEIPAKTVLNAAVVQTAKAKGFAADFKTPYGQN